MASIKISLFDEQIIGVKPIINRSFGGVRWNREKKEVKEIG